MKALPFLGIFMFALRWHQADSVVRVVPGEFVFKSGTIYIYLDRVRDFNIKGKNKINDQYHDRKYKHDYEMA